MLQTCWASWTRWARTWRRRSLRRTA